MTPLRYESLHAAFGKMADEASLSALVDIAHDAEHTKSDIDSTMHMAARMFGRESVGAVTIDGLNDEYFENIALLYVPVKDLTGITLMYLVPERTFVVGSVAEWVESLQQ